MSITRVSFRLNWLVLVLMLNNTTANASVLIDTNPYTLVGSFVSHEFKHLGFGLSVIGDNGQSELGMTFLYSKPSQAPQGSINVFSEKSQLFTLVDVDYKLHWVSFDVIYRHFITNKFSAYKLQHRAGFYVGGLIRGAHITGTTEKLTIASRNTIAIGVGIGFRSPFKDRFFWRSGLYLVIFKKNYSDHFKATEDTYQEKILAKHILDVELFRIGIKF